MVFGTDLYGSVDEVGNTSIQTKFFHIGRIPLIPLQSMYYVEGSEEQTNNLNLLVYSSNSSAFTAIECNELNSKSVIIGYLRTIFGIIGFGCFIFLFLEPNIILGLCLFLSLIIVASTYGFDDTNVDDIIVRQFSEEYFGIGFNPAKLSKEMAKNILDASIEMLESNGIDEIDFFDNIEEYDNSVVGLILVKLQAELVFENKVEIREQINKCVDAIGYLIDE